MVAYLGLTRPIYYYYMEIRDDNVLASLHDQAYVLYILWSRSQAHLSSHLHPDGQGGLLHRTFGLGDRGKSAHADTQTQ